MKWQYKVLIGLAVAGFVSVLCIYGFIKGGYNTMISQEQSVVAQYKQNQNVYSNMWKTFKEMAQVTTMQTEDLEKVFKGAIEGRYGTSGEGSKAVFLALKEDNPRLDTAIYKQVQAAIASGRATFTENQQTLLDKKRVYVTNLQSFPNNILAGFFRFPRIDLDKYDIVTDDRTEGTFKTKKDEEVRLR